MIFESVELENIRSYKKCKIFFSEGINFISGDIGSGKSSILQGIEFCLFGFKRGDLEAQHLLRKGTDRGKVILNIIKDQQQIQVCRVLKKRKNNITQENGYIICNNETIKLSPTEINSYLFQLLNLPMEFITKNKNLIYRFTIYTPQEQLKEILFEDADKRLELIRKVFDIDKYNQINNAINIYVKRLKEYKMRFLGILENKEVLLNRITNIQSLIKEKELINQKILSQKNIFHNKILKIEDEITNSEKELLIIEKERGKINGEINLTKKKLEEIKSLEEELVKILKIIESKEKEKINVQILELNDEIKMILKEKEKITNEITQIKKNKDNFNMEELILKKNNLLKDIKKKEEIDLEQNYLKRDLSDITELKCIVKDLEVQIKLEERKQKRISRDLEQIISLEKDLLVIKEHIKNTKFNIDKLQKELTNILDTKVCSFCKQEISLKHKKKIKTDLASQIEKLKQEKIYLYEKEKYISEKIQNKKILEEQIKDISKKLANHTSQHKFKEDELKKVLIKKEKINLLIKKSQTIKDLELLNEDLKNIEKEINTNTLIKEKISTLEKDLLNYDNILNAKKEQIKTSKKNITLIEEKIEREKLLKQKIKTKKSILKELNRLDKTIISIRNKEKSFLNEKITKEKSLKSVKENYESILKNLNLNLGIITSKKEEHKQLIQDLNKIELYEKKIVSIEKLISFLSGNCYKLLEQMERIFFTKLYYQFDEYLANIFTELIETSSDFDLRINETFSPIIEQNGFEIDLSNLSGGEKSSLAIAYRLALKHVIEKNVKSLKSLSVLIFDEPTDGLSREQVLQFGEILRDLNTKQIIIVSHDEKLESIGDKKIKLSKKRNVTHILNS